MLLICATPVWCQDRAVPDQKNVEQALAAFVTAFDNLDWPAFRACFSGDATVFYPAPQVPKRVDTASEFNRAWLSLFDSIKKSSGRSAPPYMDLQPRDLRVDVLSPEVAITTFHLVREHAVSRRTLVWKKFADGWKIVHLHASNLTLP